MRIDFNLGLLFSLAATLAWFYAGYQVYQAGNWGAILISLSVMFVGTTYIYRRH
jgi:hypothetical protein